MFKIANTHCPVYFEWSVVLVLLTSSKQSLWNTFWKLCSILVMIKKINQSIKISFLLSTIFTFSCLSCTVFRIFIFHQTKLCLQVGKFDFQTLFFKAWMLLLFWMI